jgi:hypothetical protein
MDIVFKCKHCNECFIVNKNDFNCKILRHGVIKTSLQAINPHETKEICDKLFNDNLIYGCGKPLMIVGSNEKDFDVIVCHYI